ncbi:hypothetical protein D3C79_988800 [compost metagenome]
MSVDEYEYAKFLLNVTTIFLIPAKSSVAIPAIVNSTFPDERSTTVGIFRNFKFGGEVSGFEFTKSTLVLMPSFSSSVGEYDRILPWRSWMSMLVIL